MLRIVFALGAFLSKLQQTKKETFKADSIIDIMPDLFTRFQLATLTTSQAAQWAKYAGLALPYFMPKARLLMWADWMLKDDRLIEKEGIKSLSLFELREASMIRGIPQSQKLESYRYYQKALQSHLTLSKKTQNYVKSKWMVDEARAKAMKKPLPPPWDSELTDTNLKSVLASAVILSRALQNSRRRI